MCFEKNIVLALVFFFSKKYVVSGEKIGYAALFSDSVRDCEDFTNEFIDFNLTITPLGLDTSLCGSISLKEDVDNQDNVQFKIEVYRYVDGVLQFIGSNIAVFCDNLDDVDSAWYTFTSSMGITTCPLKKKSYEMCDVVIDFSRFEPRMRPDYCGEYTFVIKLLKPAMPKIGVDTSHPSEHDVIEVIGCHEVDVNLIEIMSNR